MNMRSPLRRHRRGTALPRLVALLVLAFGALWAGSSPALATTTSPSVEQQVAAALQLNPGSLQLNQTDVQLAPGVVMTVADPAATTSTAVAALPSNCPSGYLCVYQDANFLGAHLNFYYCALVTLNGYYFADPHAGGATKSWRDNISSIYNHQSGSALSSFYNYGALTNYRLIGNLSAGNYLQALNLNRSQEGGTWNDKIDQIRVC
jgi:hypothetical protein